MGGLYEEKRTRPLSEERASRTYRKGGAVLTQPDIQLVATQRTRSYRSGSGEAKAIERGAQLVDAEGRPIQYVSGDTDLYNAFYSRQAKSYDRGHPFLTEGTVFWRQSPLTLRIQGSSGSYWYDGVVLPPNSGVLGLPADWTLADANAIGSGFIRLTAPTAPAANVALALGEALQGLPRMFGHTLRDRVSVFRSAGSEYLNVTFGWAPFISDLTKVLLAVRYSSQILQQYQRDSGRVVRRQRTRDAEKSVTDSTGNGQLGYAYGLFSAALPQSQSIWHVASGGWNGLYTRTDTVSTTYRFAGAYTYLLNFGDEPMEQLVRFEQLANKLLGTRLTPEVLWNLTPWSWLADWFANIGSIAANNSYLSSDGLVLKYGYVMREIRQGLLYNAGGWREGTGKYLPSITVRSTSVKKERVQATPYGFGANPSNFTSKQWAVLAALGLTKGGARALR